MNNAEIYKEHQCGYAYKIGDKYIVCFRFDDEETANEIGRLVEMILKEN